MDPVRQTTIQLLRPLNAKAQDMYQIFVYVTLTTLRNSCFGNGLAPDPNNTALLFFDIKITASNKNRPYFIDATDIMCKRFELIRLRETFFGNLKTLSRFKSSKS